MYVKVKVDKDAIKRDAEKLRREAKEFATKLQGKLRKPRYSVAKVLRKIAEKIDA